MNINIFNAEYNASRMEELRLIKIMERQGLSNEEIFEKLDNMKKDRIADDIRHELDNITKEYPIVDINNINWKDID